MAVKFSKYEGAGNDFVIIDNRAGTFGALEEMVAALCDRRFGIGADGVMLLEDDPSAEFRMRYFNSDGPEATMCGNGGRCIALFAHHLGIGDRCKAFTAVDGPHTAEIVEASGDSAVVTLQMTDVEGIEKRHDGLFMDTGSPHYVEFVDDVDSVDVFSRGNELRYSSVFEDVGGANINFVEFTGKDSIKVRTYERGVENETLACGTGAVASALAAALTRPSGINKYHVEARGGRLQVAFGEEGQDKFEEIFLTGPARKVFEGEFNTENFLSKHLLFEKNI